MAGWTMGAASLPSTHVFVTAAYGRRQKTVAVPRWAAMMAASAMAVAAVWLLGCTAYVIGHDSLLAAAMRHERDLQYGYEDRIVALQRQLDRSTSLKSQLERTVSTRLDSLSAQESDLHRQAAVLTSLAEAVRHLAPRAGDTARAEATPAAQGATASRAPSGSLEAARDPSGDSPALRLATLTTALSRVDDDQQTALLRLQGVAASRLSRLRAALGTAGLTMARFAPASDAAVGGPFVPLAASTIASPFERASLMLKGTLDQAERLKAAVDHTPFEKPLEGTPEVTSPFGARTDPFLGRLALHTGIDLREDAGTTVLATAAGRVSFAGTASGYGNMVEIDHGSGLSTRYAHLSAITVAVGTPITAGDGIGRVGATGRATGPHLHYETRIDGEPVDPVRFLNAGRTLAEGDAP
ncbi:M23 family metallopeptidase [Lichenihabitans sp. Uapishka_5]|uniref:M23 family metallopeptidase n=1 Tax=Lichenihabitans sp. Uapishka_5 TaxID=3037302 RepID=UPI0029E80271|nr:M23 family metallopeptidase [Lichenihabitans sp. Uapishka_5]MDX7950381.1 M23 family metallopeptidase [Lichenihabitans sp. Uapishka_5]